jgi:hypothetical protein
MKAGTVKGSLLPGNEKGDWLERLQIILASVFFCQPAPKPRLNFAKTKKPSKRKAFILG